jgi:hypothetical protein
MALFHTDAENNRRIQEGSSSTKLIPFLVSLQQTRTIQKVRGFAKKEKKPKKNKMKKLKRNENVLPEKQKKTGQD